MSGSVTSPRKFSIRQKFKSLVSTSSASPPPPPPTPLSTASASATTQNAVSSATASTQPPFGTNLNITPSAIFQLQQPQQGSNPTSTSILDQALQLVPQPERTILQRDVCTTSSDIYSAVDQSLRSVKDKRQICLDKRWKYTIGGREIVLRDEADKLVGWLDRFKSVGDVVSNADPIHAGLPWAGIRLLLEVAVTESKQMASLMVGFELVFYTANRLKAYTEFLFNLPAGLTRSNLQESIVLMYAHMLRFLAQAIQIYQSSNFQRFLSALWKPDDIANFEQTSNELAIKVEADASNCDRDFNAKIRETVVHLQQNLHQVLAELLRFRGIQVTLDSLNLQIDLGKIPYAKGAIFDAYDTLHRFCHPATRIDLLKQIQQWAIQPDGKNIFWLSGAAGTGKSTISCTMAHWLKVQATHGRNIDLGASFFFKRGEGDRDSAIRFFPTIVRQLVLKISGLDMLVAKEISSDPFIFDKALAEQFRILLLQPLQKLNVASGLQTHLVIVVDALDECENESDIKIILKLWSHLAQDTTIRLRLFLTSRPELPIRLGFKNMSTNIYQDVVLQDAVPQNTIREDLLTYLQDGFSEIRQANEDRYGSRYTLPLNWPGNDVLQNIVDVAIPLFIIAATIYRFISDLEFDPQERLNTFLTIQNTGQMEQVATTYLPVLSHLTSKTRSTDENSKLCKEFRMIVGSIVCLAAPMSVADLSTLLQTSEVSIVRRLNPLHSVLRVPEDRCAPVRVLHLSFPEYLLGNSVQGQPFAVSSPDAHYALMQNCLRLLSDPTGLRQDMCRIDDPSRLRKDISSEVIANKLPQTLQYACLYWVHHVQNSCILLEDDGDVHLFLQRHYLHWLEALSLMGRLSSTIKLLGILRLKLSTSTSQDLHLFLEDARRFILANRYIADKAPLQLYLSCIVFAPLNSIVRTTCGLVPPWLQDYPQTQNTWGFEIQQLQGHDRYITGLAFSTDGSLIASSSIDSTVRLWNSMTGQEVQMLKDHESGVVAVVFSPDDLLLASASLDHTIRLWDVATGYVMRVLQGHAHQITAMAFYSHDSGLLASASGDQTIRIWNVTTGQEIRKLDTDDSFDLPVVFFSNGTKVASCSKGTVKIWDIATGQMVQVLQDHEHLFKMALSSSENTLLALASIDKTMQLWNVTTGQMIHKLVPDSGFVLQIAFSPERSLLAAASTDRMIRLWNLETMQEVQVLKSRTHEGINTMLFSPDGSMLASASDNTSIRLWDVVVGGQVLQSPNFHHKAVGAAICSSNNSSPALTPYAGTVQQLEVWEKKQELQILDYHDDSISVIKFSIDGRYLASGSFDETIRVWNGATGERIMTLNGHEEFVYCIAFSPDSKVLASGSGDHTVRVWDVMTGEKIKILKGHTKAVREVAYSPDGTLLASASDDKTVRIWTARMYWQNLHILVGHTHPVNAMVFSHDCTLFALVSMNDSLDRTVWVWSIIKGGQLLHKLSSGKISLVNLVTFSPDSSLLAVGSMETVQLWDIATGQKIQQFNKVSCISKLEFTNGNKTLVTDWEYINLDDTSDERAGSTFHNFDLPFVAHKWIEHGGRNLLWLPPDFRGPSAVHGQRVVIGTESGRLHWWEFNLPVSIPRLN